MNTHSKTLIRVLAAAGLVLIATWIWISAQHPNQPRTFGMVDERASGAKVVDEGIALAASEPSTQRVSQAEPAQHPASSDKASDKAPAHSRSSVRFRVQVLDIRGQPVAGVHVGTRKSGKELATSDALGSFEFELTENQSELVALDSDWVTVRYDRVRATEPDAAHFLIVAPPLALSGKVVDASARPLDGAVVKVDIPIAAFAGFPLTLDSTGVEAFATKSGPDGAFDLERAPSIAKARLVTSYPKLQADNRALPSQSAADLYIELKELSTQGAFLDGVVVHADDKPAPGARVLLGSQEATADKAGRFRMALAPTEPTTPLAAVLTGFQPAVVPDYGRVLESTDRHPQPVRLVLGPPPLSISGHVLDVDGKPARKWTVTLVQGTVLSQFQIPVITAERITASRESQAVTGKDGSFRLGGLRDIAYRLQAWNEEGLMIQSPPIRAGTDDVIMQVPSDAFVEKISGHVRSRDGLPLADLVVDLVVVTERTSFGSAFRGVKSARTKTDGSFELAHVPRHLARLSVSGESVQSADCELDDVDIAQPIEITATRMVRFRFEGEVRDGSPDAIAVLDVDGTMLGLVTRDAGGMSSMNMAPLTDGRSHVLSVSEKASRLVLYKDGAVISSQPIRLSPSEIAVVRREP